MSDKNCSEQKKTADVDRRALLRRGGAAVVSGVAGLAVVETAAASTAQALSGDPVVMGSANTAGGTTSLTSTSAGGPTFTVENTQGMAPLHLKQEATPSAGPGFTNGDLFNFDGDLYYTDALGTAFVYTADTANQLLPITPQRILDTRTAAGRTHIKNAAGNLDSAGRLRGGHSIVINLATLEVGATAAFCNLTAVSPLAAGYLTLWPGATGRPPTSSVNFAAGAVVANFAVTGTTLTDTVSIFASATSHVLLDVTAFAVGYTQQVVAPTVASPATNETAQRLAAHAKAGTLPHWFKPL
jgi:hypothetical protein